MGDPSTTLWGSTSPAVVENWGDWADSADWASLCPDGSDPHLIERDGQQYPTCLATGIFYAPPFLGGVLAQLAWPDEWEIIPPG